MPKSLRHHKSARAAHGSLPARFRRLRLLIVGCGDVGMRAVQALQPVQHRMQILALSSQPERRPLLRAAGLQVLAGNLDEPRSLCRLAGLAQAVLHLAPPARDGQSPVQDQRTRALIQALRRATPPARLVYGSTTGVYGNRQGAWTDETAPLQALTPRAQRRVDAEHALRDWGRTGMPAPAVCVLRIPGIYAPDRPGGTPRERLVRGTAVLAPEDDVYTNHIHADDLARACIAALWRGKAQRNYNCNDDSCSLMGDYFDRAADFYGLPRPPRLSWQQAQQQLPPMLLSFMAESRRLRNGRIKRELRLQWRYPTPEQGLRAGTPVQSRPC